MKGVQNNDVAAVGRVLQYDNVDHKNFNVNGSLHESLLHVAARNNNHELCKMLLKFGADVNIFNYEDQTPRSGRKKHQFLYMSTINKKAKMQRKENFIQQSIAYLCEKKRFYYV